MVLSSILGRTPVVEGDNATVEGIDIIEFTPAEAMQIWMFSFGKELREFLKFEVA